MVRPIREFEKWFNVEGTWQQDPTTGKIIVQGDCTMWRRVTPVDQLPWEFDLVSGNFNVSDVRLLTLKGCPREVGGSFVLHFFRGENLLGGPVSVGKEYWLARHKNLKSLEGLAQEIGGRMSLTYDSDLGLLRTLVAKGGVYLEMNDSMSFIERSNATNVGKILNSYKGQGRAGAFDCRQELKKAGFEGNARW